MKSMKKVILLLFLSLNVTIAFSQKQKIGHVNTQEILQSLYIKDSIQFKLVDFQKVLENESRRIQSELYNEQIELEKLKDSLPTEIFNQRYQRLMSDSKRFQEETLPQMQNSLKNKELFYIAPIEKKITEAIQKIAKNNSFTYIINLEATLYAGGQDITKLVRLELGLPEEAEKLTLDESGNLQNPAFSPIGR
tara:strand:- start:31 stop:609 length:579 start_codon:yes stop_codon:yes gene_type:complete